MSAPVVNPYANVESRYLHPRPAATPQAWTPSKEKIPENPAYKSVEARYNHHKDAPPPRAREITPDPFLKVEDHKRLTKMLHGDTASKFMNSGLYAPNQSSPRRQVEERLQSNRRVKGWRNDTVSASTRTFDDLLKVTDKVRPLPKTSKAKGVSQVHEYVLHGTPIKHHTMDHLVVDGNEIHNKAKDLIRRPSSSGGPRWQSPGPQTMTFAERQKSTQVMQNQFKKEQDLLKAKTERRLSAHVPKSHVPRVAMLTPSFQLAQLQRHQAELHASALSAESPGENGDASYHIEDDEPSQSDPNASVQIVDNSVPPAATAITWVRK